MIYLDNAATTQIKPEVLDAMMPYLQNNYGNAGSLYSLGSTSKKAIAEARESVANLLHCKPEQVIFTSGGSESNNLAIFGLLDYFKQKRKTHIIYSPVEHDSVINAIDGFCKTYDFYSSETSVSSNGVVIPKYVKDKMRPTTGLVSVMYVNNETGSENEIMEIAKLCSENDVLFHTDCVQAAGTHTIDTDQIGCDLLSISSHKIHGPKGVGALFVRDTSLINPLIYGGHEQEFGLRAGTENVAGIVGFGKACEIVSQNLRENDIYMSMLKQVFYQCLSENLDKHGLKDVMHINGEPVVKHGKTLNIRFDGVDSETLILMLDAFGICISAGSACRSYESQPSHVLLAMGLDPDSARDSVRISFSVLNTPEEITSAAKQIAKCVKLLNRKGD